MRVLSSEAESDAGSQRKAILELMERVARKVLESEELPDNTEVSVVLAGDDLLCELNRQYRGTDAPTDVLSFAQDDRAAPSEPEMQQPVLGDVVISFQRARAQAKEYGHSLEREVAFLVVHGVLHLLGYEHETPVGRKCMSARTEEILALLGLESQ